MLHVTDNMYNEFHHINTDCVEQTLANKKKITVLIFIIRVFLLVHLLQTFWSLRSRKITSNGQCPCMSSELKQRGMSDQKYFSYKYFLPCRSDCLNRQYENELYFNSWKSARKTHYSSSEIEPLSIKKCVSPTCCWDNMPLHICSPH